jgi:hypothetical protein
MDALLSMRQAALVCQPAVDHLWLRQGAFSHRGWLGLCSPG